ncbi:MULTISPECIES: type I-C CRISPR-associated endonuclease Cas1c [unclassified Paenibacillus]|uniref:type I-C CRISPR-associated endonuclease Cas1c n=1 Tax=unclassified Paenibacillus TaxID=185978 RepID=UPI00095563F1|nr:MULTISPECIES: type I-C CRISPR-associated endonuclease Cas1c [unclassified Paenibacillus]ASS67076.1 type I-C CRISPR-associated endonuclease Cas1 [Paenibacillus sp. RUD330]SIQ90893.1 CRISP-associated protein Cas1 [Paenibacillus sp. RU4X]SIR11761.1 CRISP-associated protein Cas1 [Paenibacillus sp. RU4T]
MKKLLNTLFVTTPDTYLSKDGENIVIRLDDQPLARYPLHNLEAVCTFGYAGVSPALMGACAERGIDLAFMTRNGRFLARVVGESKGNVVLRKEQYRISDDERRSAWMARNMIVGKLYNMKWVLERASRDHSLRLNVQKLKRVSSSLIETMGLVRRVEDLEVLRGLEGSAAVQYNSVFDQLILQQKEDFFFHGRNKRPPLDNVNALLSFAYSLLANEMRAALEAAGLDAYVGFMHRDRPGRASLALDLMEELRSVYADRFVLTLINKKIVSAAGFTRKENGAVLMDDETRKKVLKAWQERKQEKIVHPYLNESISWGLVPYAQALLLARTIRGDLDEYPPLLWK